jgi:hypothetical protein
LFSSAARIWPPKGPKLIGTTAGPSSSVPVCVMSVTCGGVGDGDGTGRLSICKTTPFSDVTIMLKPNVPTWSNVIPV